MLLALALRAGVAATVIRHHQTRLLAVTEQAMKRAMKGEPATAVAMLLTQGEQTLNAKLLDMAALLARRRTGRHGPSTRDSGNGRRRAHRNSTGPGDSAAGRQRDRLSQP